MSLLRDFTVDTTLSDFRIFVSWAKAADMQGYLVGLFLGST